MLHVSVTCSSPLKNIVATAVGCSAEEAIKLIHFGSVYKKAPGPQMEERKAKRELLPDTVVEQGSYCRIHPRPRTYSHALKNTDWKSRIIKETPSFIVINKPAGVPSSPAVDNLYECVPECLKTLSYTSQAQHHVIYKDKDKVDRHRREDIYMQVLHRLDIDTSGLMVLGKNAAFTREYNMQLAARRPLRKYRALVSCYSHSDPSLNGNTKAKFSLVYKGQTLKHMTVVSSKSPREFFLVRDNDSVVVKPLNMKECLSRVVDISPYVCHSLRDWKSVLPSIGNGKGPWQQWYDNAVKYIATCNNTGFLGFQQIELELETGRTHQLRGQLSNLGHDGCFTHIAGDLNYRGPTSTSVVLDFDTQSSVIEGAGTDTSTGYRSSDVLGLQSVGHIFTIDGVTHAFSLSNEESSWWPLTKYLLSHTNTNVNANENDGQCMQK